MMTKMMMKSQSLNFSLFALLVLSAALAGCQTPGHGKHNSRSPASKRGANDSIEKEANYSVASLQGEIQKEFVELNTKPTEAPAAASLQSSSAVNAATTSPVVEAKEETTPFLNSVKPIAKASLVPVPAPAPAPGSTAPAEPLQRLKSLDQPRIELSRSNDTPLIFDIPVTYNDRVRQWIRYFQTDGRGTFKNWLERSARFLPVIQFELARNRLPQDLAYIAMIESGFVPGAVSHAGAKGMWQFIVPTAERYGLKIDWWIDERKDFMKSTRAAIRYMTDLYGQFESWYLVAASYNMGENGVRRLLQRHRTTNFWELADLGALPRETTDYVPKIIAAMLISKAPALYGFRELDFHMPLSFETASVPGGTEIAGLAVYLGVSEKYLKDLNPELIKGFVPSNVRGHTIRVPKGSMFAVSQFVRLQAKNGEPSFASN